MGRAVVSGAADPLTGVSGLAADAFSSYRPEVATAVCVGRAVICVCCRAMSLVLTGIGDSCWWPRIWLPAGTTGPCSMGDSHVNAVASS
jgi:hypothetical protein